MKSALHIVLAIIVAVMLHGAFVLVLGGRGLLGSAGGNPSKETPLFRVRLAEAELSIEHTSRGAELTPSNFEPSTADILQELEDFGGGGNLRIRVSDFTDKNISLADNETHYVTSKLRLNYESKKRLLPAKIIAPYKSELVLKPTTELMRENLPYINREGKSLPPILPDITPLAAPACEGVKLQLSLK